MAKIIFDDGMAVEGTVEELIAISKKLEEQGADKPAPLQVGDYAKVVVENYEHKVGDIIELIRAYPDIAVRTFDFRTRNVVTGKLGYIATKHIVHATDEEVELVENWEMIGRKPGEFREGDVVRYVGNSSMKGRIVEIECVKSSGRFCIDWSKAGNAGRSYEKSKDLELITPVEARFDK